MSASLPISRAAFEEILKDHESLIRLANDLELRLHEVGEHAIPDPARVTNCQRAAGDLIHQLRHVLFRFDQQVYPLLDPDGDSRERDPTDSPCY